MRLTIVLATLALTSAAMAQEPLKAVANFTNSEGNPAGTAALTQAGVGVLMELDLTGLPPGEWVAFHVHETGTCDAASHYQSAGGHFNPTGKDHGYLAPNGPHAGDMPNQSVGADGVLRAQVYNPSVTLGEGDAGIRGRALMIHAKPDDYTSQPSGDAGDRLACAVIE
jgi:Cu-Zn family superoxide dismutase